MPALVLKDVPTILSRFIEHWSATNAALAPKSLVLRGGYGVAQLTIDRATFEANQTSVTESENTTETASEQRRTLRKSLRERIRQFRAALLSDFAETEFASAAPTIPLITAGDAAWSKALTDLADLWTRLNSADLEDFTAPLTLVGGYTVAQLIADTAALTAASHTLKEGEQASKNLRRTRDSHLKTVQAQLVRYRKAVLNRLPEGHALLASLPGLE
jgi:hypothetical protein